MSSQEPERERERDPEQVPESGPYTDTDLRQLWPDTEQPEPEPEPDSRRRRAVDGSRAALYALTWPVVGRLAGLANVFRSSEGRTAALVVVAYVTGIAGLALSFVGDPTAPNGGYGAAGIALMGITFACLFLLSVSVLNTTGQGPRSRGRHGRGHGRGRGRGRNDDR